MNAMIKRTLYGAALLITLTLSAVAGHNIHFYGMPWQHAAPELVGCVEPAPDGPVFTNDGTAGWPAVCSQWSDTPSLNGGAALSLWGPYCVGLEVYGAPSLFGRLPLIGGTADC